MRASWVAEHQRAASLTAEMCRREGPVSRLRPLSLRDHVSFLRPTARLAPPRARRPWRLARRVVSGALGPASPRRQGTWRQPSRVAAQPAARGSAHTTWGAKVAPRPSYGVEGQCTYLLFSRAASRSSSATAPKQTWRDSGAPTPEVCTAGSLSGGCPLRSLP